MYKTSSQHLEYWVHASTYLGTTPTILRNLLRRLCTVWGHIVDSNSHTFTAWGHASAVFYACAVKVVVTEEQVTSRPLRKMTHVEN
jgi:hypothetical protein